MLFVLNMLNLKLKQVTHYCFTFKNSTRNDQSGLPLRSYTKGYQSPTFYVAAVVFIFQGVSFLFK